MALMEVFGWTPTDFASVTPRFRSECLLYLRARSRYARQKSRDQESVTRTKSLVLGRRPR